MTMRASTYIIVLVLALSGASARRDLTQDFTSGGHCRATGISGKYGEVENLWVAAVAKVVYTGCTANGESSGKAVISALATSFADWAKAAVNVYAFAFAKCTTVDGTSGCAAANAHANKMVKAKVGAYAKAAAKAFNTCPKCDPTATARLVTNVLVEITAAAKAHVNADVCISGDGKVVDKARTECWAESTANAAAMAFAKILLKGNCMALAAHVKVDTYVKIHVNPTLCTCEGWVSQGQGTKEPIWFPKVEKHCEFHAYEV